MSPSCCTGWRRRGVQAGQCTGCVQLQVYASKVQSPVSCGAGLYSVSHAGSTYSIQASCGAACRLSPVGSLCVSPISDVVVFVGACWNESPMSMSLQELVLILEDDMEILSWPSARLPYLAPPDWGNLQLYSSSHRALDWYTKPASLWVPWTVTSFSTGAYLMHHRSVRQV